MGVLSLAALSILDAGPIGQVYAAKAGGFRSVGLRLQPLLATDQAIVGDAEREAALLAALAQTGLSVLEIGVFPLKADTRVSDFEPVVAFSARIGARYLVCPIEDEDETRRVRTFAAMCELAARYGMEALVEFNPYSGCRSLADAAALAARRRRPNGKLLIDVLHLSRSGGSPADVRAIDPASVSPRAFLRRAAASRAGPQRGRTAQGIAHGAAASRRGISLARRAARRVGARCGDQRGGAVRAPCASACR
jgi:hypothetical protein